MHNRYAELYLVIVAALWGLTFPLIENSMKEQDPFLFVALRFTLASLPLLPYFFKRLTLKFLIVGGWIGLLNAGAFITQTIGLQTLNASRAAFLTGTYVLLIPLLSPLFHMGFPKKHDFISAFICCTGIYVLTGCDAGLLSIGDLWIAACTLFIAASIIYIGKQSKDNLDPYMLAAAQIIMTTLFSWAAAVLFSDFNFSTFANLNAATSLFICSFLATILAIILQSKYQKYVSLQNAAVIFSLEPLFAACFDAALTYRLPSAYTIVGGLIIISSILYLELSKLLPLENESLIELSESH